MKVELIEQLGITPTPGGIDKLLQLQDTQNYSESIINPAYGRMADIEGLELMEMEMERNDPYAGIQIRKKFNDGGIVNLRMGGSLSSGFDTDDWELDDYNQQIQELKEEKRSLGFSGENSQRKTQINQALRGLRLERLKKRFRGFGSGIAETLGRVNVADTTGMAQPPSDAQLDQFAEAVDAGSDTATREVLPLTSVLEELSRQLSRPGGYGIRSLIDDFSDLLQGARELRESSAATGPGMAMPFFTGVQEEPLIETAVAAEAPTGYALPPTPEIQEDQWVTLDPMKLSWRQRTAPFGEFSGELEEQFGNFSDEYSPQKSRNRRWNAETREWEYRAPPDYMEKKAWINAMKSPARSGYQMAEGGIVGLWQGGEATEHRQEDPQADPWYYDYYDPWGDQQKEDIYNQRADDIRYWDQQGDTDEDERERQYLETQENIQTAAGYPREENENDARSIWNDEEWKWSEERGEWVSSDYVAPINPYAQEEVPIEEIDLSTLPQKRGVEDEKGIEEIIATGKKPAWDWTDILAGILPIWGIGSLAAAGSPVSTVSQTQSNIPEEVKVTEPEIQKAIEEITVTGTPDPGILGGLTPEQIATATAAAAEAAAAANATDVSLNGENDVSLNGEPTMEEITVTETMPDTVWPDILAGLGGAGGIGALLDVLGLNAPGATTNYLDRLSQLSDLLSGGGGASADSGAVYLPGGWEDMAPIYYPFASEPTKAYNIAQGGPFSFMTGPPQESLVQNLGYDNVPGVEYIADGAFVRRNGLTEGPGTETSDDIPAMLSDGEFVTNAEANRGIGLMALMNQGAPQQTMMDPEQQRLAGARQMYLQQALGQQMAKKMRGG